MESLGSVSWPISILALGKWECLFHPLGLQPPSLQNLSAASGPLLEENSFLKETGSYPLRAVTGGQRNPQSHLALLLLRGVGAIVVTGLMASDIAAAEVWGCLLLSAGLSHLLLRHPERHFV